MQIMCLIIFEEKAEEHDQHPLSLKKSQNFLSQKKSQSLSVQKDTPNVVFHVLHVNISVNIILLNRKFSYAVKIC